MYNLSPRQVHLDFHTSEAIKDVGEYFNAKEFAGTMKKADVSSVTVFSRCHHGWLYYPSTKFPKLIHPTLKNKNLLLEQVDALHSEGIKAPVYITVQWDYQSAKNNKEWLVRKIDGTHEGDPFDKAGFYQALCVNTGYFDFLKSQTEEVCILLGDKLDGLFFDIVGIRACYCNKCRNDMQSLGINIDDENNVREFAKNNLDKFKFEITQLIRKYNAKCSIFYNAGHIGPCTKMSKDSYTHFELESLPSGDWGYLHFPVSARYARSLSKDCLGMTGKFHTSWGDFHSLKNVEALEFEVFRMLSYGFACSIGDQMYPNGKLGDATYDLIGKVYSKVKEREEWSRASKALVEAALLTSENENAEFCIPDSILGSAQMLEELALQFDIIDGTMEFAGYKLLILTDDFIVTEDVRVKLDEYVKLGGKVISCCKGGFNKDLGKYPDCFGIKYLGENQLYPDFLIAKGDIAKGLFDGNPYVIYKQAVSLERTFAKEILFAGAPYFNRTGKEFCSHSYTPMSKANEYPVGFRNQEVIVFSHPLFSQYRDNAPKWCKTLIENALEMLLPNRIIKHNGPSTLSVTVLKQETRTNIHILTHIPVRKSATIDIIEDRPLVCDLVVEVGFVNKINSAKLVPENIDLLVINNKIFIPKICGYGIIELK